MQKKSAYPKFYLVTARIAAKEEPSASTIAKVHQEPLFHLIGEHDEVLVEENSCRGDADILGYPVKSIRYQRRAYTH